MTEISEILKDVPNLTWHGKETTPEEINTLIKNGVKYEELKRVMGGVL